MKSPSGEKGRIILEMRNISKKFPGVIANDRVSFTLRAGEIHCILGENGAGKTTLMNILFGLYAKDGGDILVDGRRVSIESPRDALTLGIGMIHQTSTLVPGLSALENIVLGSEPSRGPFLEQRRSERDVRQLMNQFNLEVNLKAKAEKLSMGERQKVEVLRALHRGTRILIMDEPTSVLTPQEKEALMKTLKEMTARGDISSIVFITHKLPDVMAVSDRVTILRKGNVVDVLDTNDSTVEQLAHKMVGRDVAFEVERGVTETGETLLEVKNLRVLNEDGTPALSGVSISVRRGEIFGIAGVSGNGQKALVEAIVGLQRATAGRILLKGEDITQWAPGKRRIMGMGYIPEDRLAEGLLPDLSIVENLVLGVHSQPAFTHPWVLPFDKRWFIHQSSVNEYARRLVSEYEVDTPDIDLPAGRLSGGNIQRLILARELSRSPDLLVADKPTSGLDVGSQERARRRLMKEREKGKAIVLVSEDLDEIIMLSDRIAVMYNGTIVGVIPAVGVSKETLGVMMTGGAS
ncbi:MAG: ABC transporter ATP-binding protein [Candidatus Bathyarchaeota archaeon]|nr:ABC transporter ATP-binding protein [Candidatus Bathyarchaeota archaeon]